MVDLPFLGGFEGRKTQTVNRIVATNDPSGNHKNQSGGLHGRREDVETVTLRDGNIEADKQVLDGMYDDSNRLIRKPLDIAVAEQIVDYLTNDLTKKNHESQDQQMRSVRQHYMCPINHSNEFRFSDAVFSGCSSIAVDASQTATAELRCRHNSSHSLIVDTVSSLLRRHGSVFELGEKMIDSEGANTDFGAEWKAATRSEKQQ
mmetsp:Transcript_122329/g.353649  ORF Transcript_122329/g.353649 Transcript_122329/m.353649 type:complete len:204 (-) Transcript_122329:85-696(-)